MGKPVERRGRKATDLRAFKPRTAGLPYANLCCTTRRYGASDPGHILVRNPFQLRFMGAAHTNGVGTGLMNIIVFRRGGAARYLSLSAGFLVACGAITLLLGGAGFAGGYYAAQKTATARSANSSSASDEVSDDDTMA